jgi:glycosyltransferase involved in cell wall biosynthesis
MSYSVIIPTMGRDTLDGAIDSVLAQTLAPAEIIVVAGGTPDISTEHLSKVTLIDNFSNGQRSQTAACNRNLGVLAAKSDFVAFLDDDDLWLPEKMRIQMDYLEKFPDRLSMASTLYVLFGIFTIKRPYKRFGLNQSILQAIYGRRRVLPSPYYAGSSGIVLSRSLASLHPFSEELTYCEDIWWLHELQIAGVKIHQHSEKLVKVIANPFRAAKRDSLTKSDPWRAKLRQVDPSYETNYLRGIGFRNALMRGRIGEALSLWR